MLKIQPKQKLFWNQHTKRFKIEGGIQKKSVFWEGFPDLVEYLPEIVPEQVCHVELQFWLDILAVSHVHHLEKVKEEEEEMKEDDKVEMEGFQSSEGRTYLIGEYPLLLLVLVVLHHPGFEKTAVCKESCWVPDLLDEVLFGQDWPGTGLRAATTPS